MDAQNAVESATTVQATSPSRRADKPVDSKLAPPVATTINNASSLANGHISSEPTDTTKDHAASPPQDAENWQDQNSDAETIVLAGKDGISPSKPRQSKFIKHEDKSDGELADAPQPMPRKALKSISDAPRNGSARTAEDDEHRRTALVMSKKRLHDREKHQRTQDGSSGLSSVPASPPAHRRKRSGDARSDSGSEEHSRARAFSGSLIREKSRNGDKNFAAKRKSTKLESEDDEPKKIRRPRMSDILPDSVASKDRDQRSVSAKFQHSERMGNAPRDRSHSPHGRPHRRSLSTQLPSQSTNGLTSKKRRPPPPLQPTDYHSDDSAASASSHPRNSKVRRLATPLTAESTMSPATKAGFKRHVDNHGQTQFAKACAKGEYEVAKRRLGERPEDLDFADYAGNTPLQVAALNGHEDIVQLLIQAGCNIDCRNSDKETPLLDAVENGHLEVVKLLLDAGVNPRKADAEGHEPLEKVPDDVDNAEEIRAVLREAKDKSADFRPSEDRLPQDVDTVSSQGPDSPRRSPQASAAAQRRGGTMRSTKTSNHLLYMNLDEKTLRHAAARGDEETVTRVLQVREGCDDPEALVGAARGGHNVVMELLLALGGANPDPAPVKGLPPQYSTPMLAAIGQENVKVIKLLLNQSGFDPTRRFKGEAYHEIARRREGPLWKEEEHMLKNAYDDYRRTKGLTKKATSGIRREREAEAEGKRASRKESSPETSRPPKRRLSTTREGELKKKLQPGKAAGDAKEKRRADNPSHQEDPSSPKRVAARPRKDEVVVNTNSDRESTPGGTKVPALKQKRAESDLAAGSSDGEAFKPRRKLISGRDLKGQRDKQRRSSMVSTASNDKADIKAEDVPEKQRAERPSEKYHDRTKALKRDDSRDRHSGGEGTGKRHRGSVTPPRQGTSEKDDGEAPPKRRRLDADSREVRHGAGTSPDGRKKKREVSPESHRGSRPDESDRRDKAPKVNRERALSVKSTTSERGSITVASEVPEVEMRDALTSEGEITDDHQAKETAKKEATKKRQAEAAEQEKKAEERKRREEQEAARKREEQEKERAAEEKRSKEEAAKRQAQEEEQKRAAAEDEQRRQREKDAAEKRRLEDEEKARVEQERLEREEREREEREEAERKRREDVQKQEAEARKLREAAEEEKRKEEEARISREREAAEEARKLREEEERKERDRKRAAREAEREAELQRVRQEQEQTRLSQLPPVLRWLDTCANPKQRQYAELFTMAQGVRYDTINPAATGTPAGREQWLLNTQVALLLGDKDLSLSRYTGWEKVKATNIAKKVIWRLENERYALTQGKLYGLGMELPSYFDVDPHTMGYKQLEKLRGDAAKLFFEMDLWFVKVSDFLHLVPTIPHLLDLKISIDYRELPETESALNTWGAAPAKWKQDPDASSRGYFAPRWKYYMNGILIGEDRPKAYKLSHDPFPERRVPRRGGLIAVGPDEPDYPRLCLEQGLGHLLTEEQKQAALAGAHLTPQSMVSTEAVEETQQMSPSERGSTKPVADFGNEPASPLAQQEV